MIKAFPVFSLQETLDKVVKGLRKQGRPARADNGTCKYRLETTTESGFVKFLKCAAGLLIKRRQYTEDLENQTLCRYADLDYYRKMSGGAKHIVLASIIHRNGYNLDFVRELQCVHDHAKDGNFEPGFIELAAKYNLTYTPPKVKAKRVRKPKKVADAPQT